MYAVFAILACLVLAVAELRLGGWHFYLPLVADGVFYFAVAGSRKLGLALAVIAGIALDAACFRAGFFSAGALVMMVAGAGLWVRWNLDTPVLNNAAIGFFMPVFVVLAAALLQTVFGSAAGIGFSRLLWSQLLLAGVVNSGVLILLIYLLDRIGEGAGFAGFISGAEQRKHGEEE